MTYEIIKHIGTFSTRGDKDGAIWNKEINIISWNRKRPMIDIREWSEDRSVMRSGIRLNFEEYEGLCTLLSEVANAEKGDMGKA